MKNRGSVRTCRTATGFVSLAALIAAMLLGSPEVPGAAGESRLNSPPEGFTALFSGKDLAGWRVTPKVRESWSIEDGVLESPGLSEGWGACLQTVGEYRDFVLLVDFRMPTISDSGISFRQLIPEMGDFSQNEQLNLRSKASMGHLESFYFMQKKDKERLGITEANSPHVPYIDPEVGVWHTVKLTVVGTTVTAEYDGKVILDHYTYPDGVMNMEPAPIRFQKHAVVNDELLGKRNPCPIEYRNIFIKDLSPGIGKYKPKP